MGTSLIGTSATGTSTLEMFEIGMSEIGASAMGTSEMEMFVTGASAHVCDWNVSDGNIHNRNVCDGNACNGNVCERNLSLCCCGRRARWSCAFKATRRKIKEPVPICRASQCGATQITEVLRYHFRGGMGIEAAPAADDVPSSDVADEAEPETT
eukprot:5775055-Pleurochrysis_carterae.AAC.2